MEGCPLQATNDVSAHDVGVATSASTFFRQIGGTLSAAMFLSILFSTGGDRIADAVRTAMASPA